MFVFGDCRSNIDRINTMSSEAASEDTKEEKKTTKKEGVSAGGKGYTGGESKEVYETTKDVTVVATFDAMVYHCH
jgi:phenylalanyl-tRNA synthetase beta subunit